MATQTRERTEESTDAKLSPAMALRAKILGRQGTQQIEKRLEELLGEISKAEDDASNAKLVLAGAKDFLEISEASLFPEITGKNIEERKANLAIKRGELLAARNSGYWQQYSAVETAQAAYDDTQNALSTLEREFRVKVQILSLRAAQLNFLAGAE